MKRFLAFAYESYYPCGGQGDFAGDFNSVEYALDAINEYDFLDILDTQTGEWTNFHSERDANRARHWVKQPTSGFATYADATKAHEAS